MIVTLAPPILPLPPNVLGRAAEIIPVCEPIEPAYFSID